MNRVYMALFFLICCVCFVHVGFAAERVVVCELIVELG